jgi:phosphatidylserine decarboxylase
MKRFTWADAPSQTAFPIARPGYPLIGAAAFATAVFALLGLVVPGLIGLLATLFICAFFRDPDRLVPDEPGLVVSPADGKVIRVDDVADSAVYGGACRQVSIFMNVFNVHVNRIPCSGRVAEVAYTPGRFMAADKAAASDANERNAVAIETEGGRKVVAVQVAGLIARRIICRVQAGDGVERGQRFGMICFGSRLDVYLPPDAEPVVGRGQKVSAGSSAIARLP